MESEKIKQQLNFELDILCMSLKKTELLQQFLTKNIHSVRDLYLYRQDLKKMKWEYLEFEYVVNLVYEAITCNIRFRKVDCIKLLKVIIKNNFDELPDLPPKNWT